MVEVKSNGRKRKRQQKDDFQASNGREKYNCSHYLDLPSTEEIKECCWHFCNATSNECVCSFVSEICARELSVFEAVDIRMHSTRNASRLQPLQQHALHDLYEGKLIESHGVLNWRYSFACVAGEIWTLGRLPSETDIERRESDVALMANCPYCVGDQFRNFNQSPHSNLNLSAGSAGKRASFRRPSLVSGRYKQP